LVRIYLVRHGQSTHNAEDDTPHNPDPPLTRLGREQARIAAAALRNEAGDAVALYVSPQRRALETAQAIRDVLRSPTRVCPELCESGGLHEHGGMSREEILAEWPDFLPDPAIRERGWWPVHETEREEATVYARARRALERLRTAHEAGGDTIVVVTHGRFCGVLISTMLGLGPGGYTRFPMENCALSRIDFVPYDEVAPYPRPEGAGPIAVRLRYHNRIDHLPADMVT
jgi:broad specificity phosphatase PhoE